MTPLLIGLGVVSGLELLLSVGPVWRYRKPLACALIIALSVTSGLLIGHRLSGWTLLLGLLSGYRLVNLLRLVEGRMQADYLLRVVRRSSIWLIGLQLLMLLVLLVSTKLAVAPLTWWYAVGSGQVMAAAVVLLATFLAIRRAQPSVELTGYADRDLPTLTVAIPARNETEDLTACLVSLVASTYPKLEIIVLDDCSQDRRTPEIIRGFAHDGVRFIAGEAPPEQWLAKNYAYDQLTKAASGELLLFCGVDTRFESESLTILVKTLLARKKSMLSLMPHNQLPVDRNPLSLVLQANRYVWELATPQWLLGRPPVLSTCWLIKRETLEAAGGFAAVRHGVLHERYFARQSAAHDDGYLFLCATEAMGVSCQKQFEEQQATAIRIRYPQLHRQPELVALVGLTEFSLLVWPVIIAIASLLTTSWYLLALSIISYALNSWLYARVLNLTYRRHLVSGWGLLLPAALYDIGLLNYSMWRYEFREVIWKDRNVCVPVMQVIPKLPSLK